MVDIKQTSASAASNKKQTARKKATGTRKTPGKIAGEKRTTAQQKVAQKIPRTAITPDKRHRKIAEKAFLKAERRSFEGGDPIGDWLDAETEVDASLTN